MTKQTTLKCSFCIFKYFWHYEGTRILYECTIRWEWDYKIKRKVNMAAFEDITTELSKLIIDISSFELGHG